MFLCGLEMVADGGQELVLTGDPDADALLAMLEVARQRYEPHMVTIVRPSGEASGALAEAAPFLAEFTGKPGAAATAYLCRGLMCESPVTTASELELLLARE